MNSRQKSATFVTVRRAKMTNFDPLWLEKNDENQIASSTTKFGSLLSLGVAPLTRAWQPRCCFHQCMFFELSYVAIRLWLEDQTDKGDFKVESSVVGRGLILDVSVWGRGLFIFGRHKGLGLVNSGLSITPEAVFYLSFREITGASTSCRRRSHLHEGSGS